MEPHHQLNLSLDGQHLLVMGSSHHPYYRKKNKIENAHFDRLMVFDLSGKEIKTFDFYEHLTELEAIRPKNGIKAIRARNLPEGRREWEYSHANSFYEIPDNAMTAKIPPFKKGNYIVNVKVLGLILVLDREMKQIIWSLQWQENHTRQGGGHDVQVQPNGKLLVFDNRSFISKENFSTVTEVDPLSGIKKVIYKASPPFSFFTVRRGGVQRLSNGNLLVTDQTKSNLAFEVNEWGRKVWVMDKPVENPKTGEPIQYLQIRRQDLTQFLEKNQGGKILELVTQQ